MLFQPIQKVLTSPFVNCVQTIEGTFRDYKAYGWRWEQGQVTCQAHMEHLLVGMAIATWVALMTGTWRGWRLLQAPTTGKRHTRPWEAKMSLFHLGLDSYYSVHSR